MGEVYRATDTKLGRDVALKVLPSEIAASTESLERFEREAKALAALDHLVSAGKVAADRVFIIAPRLSADDAKDKGRPTRVDFSLK